MSQLQLAKSAIHSDAACAVHARHVPAPFPEPGRLGVVETRLQHAVGVHKPYKHIVFLSRLSGRAPADLSFSCLQPFHISHCSFTSSDCSLLGWGAASEGRDSALGTRAEPVLEVPTFFIAGHMLPSLPPLPCQDNCLEMPFHHQLQKNCRENTLQHWAYTSEQEPS